MRTIKARGENDVVGLRSYPRTDSTFARANSALRNGDLKNAIALYEVAINESDEPLKTRMRFNLGLAPIPFNGA